jgi:hypothetical protein
MCGKRHLKLMCSELQMRMLTRVQKEEKVANMNNQKCSLEVLSPNMNGITDRRKWTTAGCTGCHLSWVPPILCVKGKCDRSGVSI